jgi:DNA-binding protein YbaB
MSDADIDARAAEIRQMMADQMADVERKKESMEKTQEQVQALRVKGESPGREVSLEVDSMGHLTDFALNPSAMSLSAPRLAGLILETYQRTHVKAGEKAMAIIEESYGFDQFTDIMRPGFVPDYPSAKQSFGGGTGPILHP